MPSLDDDPVLAEAREKAEREAEAEQVKLSASWQPIDLTAALDGQREPGPELLERADAKHLLYAGRVHWIMGEPESLKSWFAQLAAAQALEMGGDVLYIDYEDNEGSVVDRFKALGVPRALIEQHLSYIRPETYLRSRDGRTTVAESKFIETMRAKPYRLAVIDGVTESVTMEGLDINANNEIADWLQRLPRRLAREGMATIAIDHVTKAVDSRGRYAIGAQHKLAGLDGAAFIVEIVHPLARAADEPVTGKARITVVKDRPGWVRSVSEDRKFAGTLEITAWPDEKVSASITPMVAELAPPIEVTAELLKLLVRFGGEDSERHLIDMAEHTEPEVRAGLRWLMEKDWVAPDKRGNSIIYRLTQSGREHPDAQSGEGK